MERLVNSLILLLEDMRIRKGVLSYKFRIFYYFKGFKGIVCKTPSSDHDGGALVFNSGRTENVPLMNSSRVGRLMSNPIAYFRGFTQIKEKQEA